MAPTTSNVLQEHATGNEIYQSRSSRSPDSSTGGYVELPSDHAFSAFLAGLTPGRVLRDRERAFSRQERGGGVNDPVWARPDWAGVLASWGVTDTGVRPLPCRVAGCGEPRRGGAEFRCQAHAGEARRQRAHKEALRRQERKEQAA